MAVAVKTSSSGRGHRALDRRFRCFLVVSVSRVSALFPPVARVLSLWPVILCLCSRVMIGQCLTNLCKPCLSAGKGEMESTGETVKGVSHIPNHHEGPCQYMHGADGKLEFPRALYYDLAVHRVPRAREGH